MTTTHDPALAHLSDDELRGQIRSMQFELERRAQGPEWTGRVHEWDKPFADPRERSCRLCGVQMAPPSGADPMDANVVTKFFLRETCPR